MQRKAKFEGLLNKLRQASSKSEAAFMKIVNANPLPAFQVQKRRRLNFSCDYMATCMMPEDVDAKMVAVWTEPDGNCFYNLVSMHLSGDLSLSSEMRCRVVYELASNRIKYDNAAQNCQYYDPPTFKYIGDVCPIGTYTGVMEIMAAANVIGADIYAHYPDVNFGIRHYFNRTFTADFYRPNVTPMHFLYTRAGIMHDQNLPYWSPNHYCYMAPQTCVKIAKPWPGQAEQWQKIRNELEKVKDYLHNIPHDVITISDSDSDELDSNMMKHSDTDDEVFFSHNGCDTHHDDEMDFIDDNYAALSDIPTENKVDAMTQVSVDENEDLNTDLTSVEKTPANYNGNRHIDQNSYTDLVTYAITHLGVSRDIKVNCFDPKATACSSPCCATYVPYDTTEPLHKGFGKYQLHKNKTYSEHVVCRRGCKGYFQCDLCGLTFTKKTVCCDVRSAYIPCSASLIYIRRQGNPGTLIVPVNDHAAACRFARHTPEVGANSYDGLLSRTGHAADVVEEIRDIKQLENADGDKVYTIYNKDIPANSKPPGREWTKLNTIRVHNKDHKICCRNCTKPCPAKLFYMHSSNLNNTLIYHMGHHTCEPATNPPTKRPRVDDEGIDTAKRKKKEGIKKRMGFLRNQKMGVSAPINERLGAQSKGMKFYASKAVPPKASTQHVDNMSVDTSIQTNGLDNSCSEFTHTKQTNINETEMPTDMSPNSRHLNDISREPVVMSEKNTISTHESPLQSQAERQCNSISSPCDIENHVESVYNPQNKKSSGVENDTQHHFGFSEKALPSQREQDFLRESKYNWGCKEISNRKTSLYRRLCKGFYKCLSPVCGKTSKNNLKCAQCRSKLYHKPCPAKLYSSIKDDHVINQRNEGFHTCEQFDKQQFHEPSAGDHDTVDKIPFDISGDVVLKVRIRDMKNPWENLSDGRNWGRYETSYKSTTEKVYVRKCIGRPVCEYDDCPFYKRFHRRNIAQYEKVFNSLLCRECKSKMSVTHCHAKKTYVFSEHKPDVVVSNH